MEHEYTCIGCGVLFKTHKNGKKYCTRQCYFAFRHKEVTKICEACGNEFTVAYRFRGQKTCNHACAGALTSKRLNTREIKQCLSCGSNFEVTQSYKKRGKYCSLDCFYRHHYGRESKIVRKRCERCDKEFEKPFIQRDVRFCSKSCATTGENNGMFGKPGTMTGKKAWNNGLTLETDPRIQALGRKISVLSKEQFKNGKRSHRGSRNPMFGHTPDMSTPTQRENYSRAAIKRVLDGVSGYKTGHLTGEYIGTKSILPVKFKSSWELAAMMWWDKQQNIQKYEYEPRVIVLTTGYRAVPDFRLTYDDGTVVYCEIKPTSIQDLEPVKQKLELVRQQLFLEGSMYVLIGDELIKSMIEDIGDEFKLSVEYYKNRL